MGVILSSRILREAKGKGEGATELPCPILATFFCRKGGSEEPVA
jgi:hypothetical protein